MRMILLRILFFALTIGLFATEISAQVTVSGSSGADGNYTQLNLAFASINGTTQTGKDIVVTITANTTETASATLNAGAWTSLKIYPTASGLSVTGNLALPLIDLNGADNVTIDGRVNANGSAVDLAIVNTSVASTVGTSTIRFINDASNNSVKYCNVQGSGTDVTSGIIFISTTTGITGNDGNIIDSNTITCSSAGRPGNAIYSVGTSTKDNDHITISNNNIYNYLHPGLVGNGVYAGANCTAWTISGNSMYDTAGIYATAGAEFDFIGVYNASGGDFTIKDNYLGGSAPLCAGTWVKQSASAKGNTVVGIAVTAGTGTNTIKNNTIKNISVKNNTNYTFYGLVLNTGTSNCIVDGNTIGDMTTTGSIILDDWTGGQAQLFSMFFTGSNFDCKNNNIGAITTIGSYPGGSGTAINNIYCTLTGTSNVNISNNKIGSSTVANSINASSAGYHQWCNGIEVLNSTGPLTIDNNSIYNFNNNYSGNYYDSFNYGIHVTSTTGVTTVSNNKISNLKNATTMAQTAVAGLYLEGVGQKVVINNTVDNLSAPSAAPSVIGIYMAGSPTGNVVAGNFIHDIVSGAAGNFGIQLVTGACTTYNNIVYLTSNSSTVVNYYGIYESGAAGEVGKLYHNTVYISGTQATGGGRSYCLYSTGVAHARDIRNNLFFNDRVCGVNNPNSQFAFYNALTDNTGVTLDNNLYWAPGTASQGSAIGYYSGAAQTTFTQWTTATGQDLSSISEDPFFTLKGSSTASDYTPLSNVLVGTPISGITTDYLAAVRATPPTMGALEGLLTTPVEVWKGGTLQSKYGRLKFAFDKINSGIHTGDLEIRLTGNTNETASSVLNASGVGSASYTALNMYPTVSGVVVSGNFAAPLVDFNGADNVTVDGRVNATGTTADWTFVNNSALATTGTSTFRYRADASNNVLKYCKIKGSTTDGAGGVVFFSTGTTTGNTNNVVDNNFITNAGGNRPVNAVFSASGTAAASNTGITISNNNIYDFLNPGIASNGIGLSTYSYGWTITGNSLYETTAFAPTAAVAYNPIGIVSATGTYNFTITNNYIGGSQPLCGGMWTKTSVQNNVFAGINMIMSTTGGTASASSVQGNTISNFNWNNTTANWTGIYLYTGFANIGNITGNTVGSATAANSITLNNSGTGGYLYGIYNSGGGLITCNNNVVGSILLQNTNSTYATNFYGIADAGGGSASEIKNNTVGSNNALYGITSQSKSTAANQVMYGIYSNTGQSNAVSNNTIANLSNLTEYAGGAGVLYGFYNGASGGTISNNKIHHLSIANPSANTMDAIIGLYVSNVNYATTVTGNEVYNLSNPNAAFVGNLNGIVFNGLAAGGNRVSQNFVHDFSVSGTTPVLYGIKAQTGTTTYDNNVILLGGDSPATVYGISETGDASNSNSVYFNTVYLSGSPSSGALNSSALYSATASEARIFRNNIFVNARSNGGTASGKHYAINYAATGGTLTVDNNDYYAPGTGGVLAYYGADKATLATLQASNGKDLVSISQNPLFANAGGVLASNYIPAYSRLYGTRVAGQTIDYSGATRNASPTMGAFEGVLDYNVEVWKGGSLQGSYSILKDAFDDVNLGTYTGVLDIKIKGSTVEPTTAILNASGSGSANYTSISIYPTTSGVSVSSSLALPLIDLNGADNVTIDGRVNATGSTKSLVIENKSTSNTAGTSTIRFINGASSNTLKYTILKGSSLANPGGVILFGTTTGTGNSNNTIDNNDITNSTGNKPTYPINSVGTSGVTTNNASNIFTNNNLYDLYNASTGTNVIVCNVGTTAWTISNNSFYEPSTMVPASSAVYYAIYPASGDGYTITGNYIGGTSPLCGGTALTKTNAASNVFYGIVCSLGTTNQTLIQNNTIANIDWRNAGASTFSGIHLLAGNLLIDHNTIGASTGNDKIKLTYGADSPFYGIYTTANTVIISNNTIGAITLANSSANNATHFYGIYNASTASSNVNNNLIGNATIANSINNTSTSASVAQLVYGVYSTTPSAVINANTIANINNGTTSATTTIAGVLSGIYVTNTATITNNIIHDLSIANASTATTSLSGIAMASAYARTVSGNSIYNLNNTYASFAGNLLGIYLEGAATGNVISNNYVHDIYALGASSTTATIYGIRIVSGGGTHSNNIINLGNTGRSSFYGFYESGAAGNNNNLYHNTIYIFGTQSGGNNNSYALYTAANTNTRNFKNNILANVRTNVSAAGKNYGLYYATAGGTFTSNNNDVYTPGVGGVAGYYSADRTLLSDLQTATANDMSSTNLNPAFANAGGGQATDYSPTSTKIIGASGLGIATDYAGTNRKFNPSMGAFEVALDYNVEIWKAGALQGGYILLKNAFDDINAGVFTGALDVKVKASTTETASAVLNASGTGSASYTSVTMYPTAAGLTVSGSLAAPLIDLNGADNVTIDGRVNATGATADLGIINTSTSAGTTSAIRFIADASNNAVKYCAIKGSSTNATGGVLFFSTGTSTGNVNNVISNNNITNPGSNRPYNALFALASSAATANSGTTVSNNNFYDFFNPVAASNGIALSNYTTGWTINGNSFYETTAFSPTAAVNYYPISINSTTGTYNFTVKDNYIGGSQPLCGGAAWTKSSNLNNLFAGIYMNMAAGTASSVQNNTISNISWNSLASDWYGMYLVAGSANIGDVTANTIGSTSVANSISVTNSALGGFVIGIKNSGTLTASNNIISSITTNNTDATRNVNFYGIYTTGNVVVNILNNTIGNVNSAYGIKCNSTSTTTQQDLYGIYSTSSNVVKIIGNTILNLTNGTTNNAGGIVGGIYSAGTWTTDVNNNIIHDLTVNNSGTADVAMGIYFNSSQGSNYADGNQIYNLKNTNASFMGSMYGIYYMGYSAPTIPQFVSKNFIHDFSVNAATNSAMFYGIKAMSGTVKYSNNIISLGGNTTTKIYGVYETGDASNSNSFYFNTINIWGAPTAGALASYGLYSVVNTETRNYKNNIFANTRSNNGATGKHYGIYYAMAGGTLNTDYNDYYTPGVGGLAGYYGGDRTALSDLQTILAKEAGSSNVDPMFTNATGVLATDYIPLSSKLFGGAGTGITIDYAGTTRKATPVIGAYEVALQYNIEIWKGGALQNGYIKLKNAFDDINAGIYTGALDVKITASTTESASAVLNASGSGSASYTAINVYPTNSAVSVTGNFAAPLIDFNGADNVTIDGRVNGTGSTRDLTIVNTSVAATAGTSTIRFINDATANVVKYCIIKGSTLDATGGVLLFSTTTGSTGNDGNVIDNNNITNSADANRPLCAIGSVGTSAKENSGNTISNNSIYDFLNRGMASKGISLGANTTAWSVTGNSFYETTTFVPTAAVAYYPIYVNNTAGTGFVVSGNYIGGQTPVCGGSAWTKTNAFSNAFNGIYLNVSTSGTTDAKNNSIKNFSWNNAAAAPWFGLYVAGGKVDTSGLSINRLN